MLYSWEIADYIKLRNYILGGDEINVVTDFNSNPQLTHIIFHPDNAQYEMWDNDKNYFSFIAMPYREAEEKGLVKVKTYKQALQTIDK